MDHLEIESRDIALRYLQGRLPAAEAERFEEHLLECGECFERVRWSDDFGGALRLAAAGGALALPAPAGSRRLRRAALALAALFALALAPALWWWGGRDAAADRQALLGELGEARREIVAERRLRAGAGNATPVSPQINAPLYFLGAVRGPAGALRIAVGRGSSWVVLVTELPEVEAAPCSATLERAGAVLWQADGLVPDAEQKLVILLPASLLAPGPYTLRLARRAPDGRTAPVDTLPFVVTGSR